MGTAGVDNKRPTDQPRGKHDGDQEDSQKNEEG
jgi:hypothetical protein